MVDFNALVRAGVLKMWKDTTIYSRDNKERKPISMPSRLSDIAKGGERSELTT